MSRSGDDSRKLVRPAETGDSSEDSSDETDFHATSAGDTTDDDEKGGKGCCRCRPIINAACCCHMCYVCQFLLFMVVFPLWTKWLVTNPMPTQYWHEEYPKWPSISALGGQELAAESELLNPIEMSPIPESPESCNYSCSAWRGYRTAEMNFRVSLTLNDSVLSRGYAHTVYPVLLASADFQDWWVVADRRFAYPSPFWRARTSSTGHAYNYFTETCTRPPSGAVSASEQFTGSYILACVVWSPTAFAKITEMPTIKETELASLCNTVGGVCGWGCDSTIPSDRLPGCTADSTIEVTSTSIAGTEIPGADFKGKVEMRECLKGSSMGKCETATEKFKQWKCHKCLYDPTPISDERRLQIPGIGDDMPAGLADPDAPAGIPGIGGIPGIEAPAGIAGIGDTTATGKGSATIYTSLPRFRVTVSGVHLPEGTDVFSQPRTFVLSSSMQTKGTWTKLYMDSTGKTHPPVALDAHNKPLVKAASDQESESIPVVDPVSKHAMALNQQNRLEIEPGWCFGQQGPLYLVACAINSTTYSGDFEQFKSGQQAAPPPFNDRCMAVSGRCGHACQSDQPPMANCTSTGHIIQSKLIGDVTAEKNQSAPVWLFCYVLLIGFAVKVVMLCPGVFSQYPHCRRYSPALTQKLRYIVVTIPTAGENKSVVLRNVVGAIGCMPKGCMCRYHVALADEGHREEQKAMFKLLLKVIDNIPVSGEGGYQENVRQFFAAWTDETKSKLNLRMLKDGSKETADQEVLHRISGKSALQKLCKEGSWGKKFQRAELLKLSSCIAKSEDGEVPPGALDELEENLRDNKNAGIKKEMHLDSIHDWENWKGRSTFLRLHYLARAKPVEDDRTVKAQHVAPGIWYYNKPVNLEEQENGNSRWIALRKQAKEMEYGLQDDEVNNDKVPIRTSRGKAGGLNFVEMYLSIYADQHPYHAGSLQAAASQDRQPYLYSICDARHQYQTDFFHTTIPYFFTDDDKYPELDPKVAFTQCPQYFEEMKDKCDYLDNNNAQFFRLNCMIRNCCGGVSSCGTNGTWAIQHDPFESVWMAEKKRTRDADKRRRYQFVERSIFHESCKVEDTASSLQRVLAGQRSQFINRRLSFGLAKNPVDYLAAVQRWAEGGVVLSLQTFFSYHKGVYMLWVTFLFFIGFLISLVRLVSKTDTTWLVVQMHMVDQSVFDLVMVPLTNWVRSVGLIARSDYWKRHPQELEDFVVMAAQFVVWVASLALVMFIIFLFTELLKFVQRVCKLKPPCIWPNEMRWWGRLLISMDNLTYFLWFWTAFFWIGFNYYSVFTKRSYHFSSMGMFSFMLTVQVLSWGMVIASSMRYTLSTSMEANEVIMLTMDNIWRSTQLFYITAPLLLYSLIKGFQDYSRYQLYGEDISYWSGGDRGVMSTNLVKYWTLFLIMGAIAAWTYYIVEGHKQVGVLGSCLIVSLIALDVLHPCTYLWVDKTKLPKEKTDKMTWLQALTTKGWYFSMLDRLILNETMTGLVKWLGPAWFVAMPFLVLVLPYIGVNQAFMMIGSTTNR